MKIWFLKISHINILIMGETEVGKSTLLNAVLKANLDEKGMGDACTLQMTSYESPYVPGLKIYDTRGIKKGEYNLFKTTEDIKKNRRIDKRK